MEKLKKLRGRRPDELRVRGAQMLNARAERYGLSSLARVPSDDAFFKLIEAARVMRAPVNPLNLLDHFRARTSPSFFASFADREGTLAELRRRFGPSREEALLERARRICEGRFALLGFGDLAFGVPPDFHLEPVSERRSPLKHWSLFDELDAGVTGDKKIIWELNRQQSFATLGRAYWSSGDERYAETFVAHLNAWMDQNPPKQGINWLSSLEIAFRAISWLWAFYFFRDSPSLTPTIFLRVLKFLYLHGRHLETYLSTYSSPNTHLTGEALGLFYLGTLLPELKAATRWRETGKRILFAELARHVRPDGVYFEQTSYYHRYTTDFYTHLYLLMRANGERIEPLLEQKLAALLDHLMYITRPDGTTTLYGDDDGGRLLMLDERAANDFRATLSTGASLFTRADYKYVAGEAAEETLWLLGAKGVQAFDEMDARPPDATSRAFNDGGYYVMRDGWTSDSNYLLVDCGPHGALSGGHSHADALGIEVSARGRTMLVDPGTYTYNSSREMRDYFRHAAAHNTLTIDGQSSSVPDGPFSWQEVAQCSARVWESRERYDYFEGEHDGFARLGQPGTHTRGLLFLKHDYWVVRDTVRLAGQHRYDLNFHFAADAHPVIESHDETAVVVVDEKDDAPVIELFSFGLEFEGTRGEWRIEDGWVSECYGERERARVAIFSQSLNGSPEFVSLMIPRHAQESKASAREIETKGGRAFEVLRGDARDVLVLGRGVTTKAERIASDFDWAWSRFARDGEALEELVLRGGHSFFVDDGEIFWAGGRVGYLAARRAGDELHVETDARVDFRLSPLGAGRMILNGKAFALNNTTEALRFFDGRLDVESMSYTETLA